MPLTLRLITPARGLVEARVDEVTAPGTAGEIGILPQHVSFVGELGEGVLTYVEGGARRHVVVHGGYVEVADDVVTVLADDAELPAEIDAAAARADLERVERDLAAESEDPERIASLLRERRRAEIRARAAG